MSHLEQTNAVMIFNKFELEERATSGLALCITRPICFWSDTQSPKSGFTALVNDCSFTLILPSFFPINWVKLSWVIYPGYVQTILYKPVGIKHTLLLSQLYNNLNFHQLYFVTFSDLLSTSFCICHKGLRILINPNHTTSRYCAIFILLRSRKHDITSGRETKMGNI